MTTTEAVAGTGARIRPGDSLYFEIVEFLEDETALLDRDDLQGWLGNVAPDAVYRAPVRVTRERGTGSEFEAEMFHFDETYMTLFSKALRMTQIPTAWAENPPSRTRRVVTNIRAWATPTEGEYRVESSILLLRCRYDEAQPDLLSGRRDDLLRRDGDTFKLARRTIYFDHATLGVQNLAVYL